MPFSPIILLTKLFRRTFLKLDRFEKRSAMLSTGVPLAVLMASAITAGTILLDKQYEMRYKKVQSLGKREFTLQEEHDKMVEFLNQADEVDNLDNSVPLPTEDKFRSIVPLS